MNTSVKEHVIDERATLLLLSDVAGTNFGTEDFSLFLYSLVRMHAPTTIVELGTGLGVSAFWMALAAKRNGNGHVWTVDDFEWFATHSQRLDEITAKLREADVISLDKPTAHEYYNGLSRLLQLESYLTFVKSKISLHMPRELDRYPFSDKQIDLLFSDYKHSPNEILAILGQFLPRMSACSSILIDSASTFWPSYLLLEQVVTQLNAGKVPGALQELTTVDLGELMRNRRIVLVHLTESKERNQNSTAWLKIEPVDVFPYPKAKMRGVA